MFFSGEFDFDIGVPVLIILSLISIAGMGWAASWAIERRGSKVMYGAVQWLIRLALFLAALWLIMLFL